jgi:hypothetical protein
MKVTILYMSNEGHYSTCSMNQLALTCTLAQCMCRTDRNMTDTTKKQFLYVHVYVHMYAYLHAHRESQVLTHRACPRHHGWHADQAYSHSWALSSRAHENSSAYRARVVGTCALAALSQFDVAEAVDCSHFRRHSRPLCVWCVCMYVCVYACMYVCMYIYIYIYIHTYIDIHALCMCGLCLYAYRVR